MKWRTKNPVAAANTIETPIISRPVAIPPSLKAIFLLILNLFYYLFSDFVTPLDQPNLLLIVNKSKNIELIEIINPNIINDLDFSLSLSSVLFLVEDNFLSFLILKRL